MPEAAIYRIPMGHYKSFCNRFEQSSPCYFLSLFKPAGLKRVD